MPRSARVEQIIEALTPAEEAELTRELVRRERERLRLAAMKALADEFDAKYGAVPEDELARIEREWPPG